MKGEWVPVSRGLPVMEPMYLGGPRQARVIAWTGEFACEAKYCETYKGRIPRWINTCGRRIRVTHWMLLPLGPEEQR